MSAPLLVAFACFLAETWMFYRVLGQRKKLAGRLNQVSADLTDAEQALNVLIHERAAYKDENARLRRIVKLHAEDMSMMRIAWDVDLSSDLSLGHLDAADFFIRLLSDTCAKNGFPEGVEVEL